MVSSMPCRCSGVRLAKCECAKFTDFPFLKKEKHVIGKSEVVLVADRSRSYRHRRANPLLSVIEGMYEKCAGYNLRYCPFRSYVKSDSTVSSALRDMAILCCFIIANFVVFLNIMTRMSITLFFVFLECSRWIRRVIVAKSVERETQYILHGDDSYY